MNIKNLVVGTTLSVFGSVFSSLPLMAQPLSYNGWSSVSSSTVQACVLQAKSFLKSNSSIVSVETSGPGAYGTYKPTGDNVVIVCSPQGDQALMIVSGSSDAQAVHQTLAPGFFK